MLKHTRIQARQFKCKFLGETDLYVGREGAYPSAYGYPMTSKAPYKRTLDKWVKRGLQFGLFQKWISDAKRFASEFKRIQRQNGAEVIENLMYIYSKYIYLV